MASTNAQQQVAAEAEYMKTLCDQILPTSEFLTNQARISVDIQMVEEEMVVLEQLVRRAQEVILETFHTIPEGEEVSVGSASSAGSASTQRYETSWGGLQGEPFGEPFLLDVLAYFTRVRDSLNNLLDVRNTVLQPWYDKSAVLIAQFEAKKAEWYSRMSKNWRALAQTPAYAQFRAAENRKDDRIARIKQLGQTLDGFLLTSANELLSAKHVLLEVISAIPVSPNELEERTLAAIRNFRLATVPLVINELPQTTSNWIDRIGYEMRHVFGMDVD